MIDERALQEKLKLIEALHAGATTDGEREAAANARERIKARLANFQSVDPSLEYSFKTSDLWNKKLLIALLRRYGITPYRYRGQRYTTVMARVPMKFVNETLWPEYLALSKTLSEYLKDITDRVIAEGIESDASEPEERNAPQALTNGRNAAEMNG